MASIKLVLQLFSVAGPVPRSNNNEVVLGFRKSLVSPMPLGPAILQWPTVAASGRWAWTKDCAHIINCYNITDAILFANMLNPRLLLGSYR